MYHYTVLIFKCRLLWQMGKGDYVYEYMEDLLASGEKDSNASDYLNDMKDLCQLFRDMKEYEYWKQTISAVETYTIDQKTVFFQLFLTELWMRRTAPQRSTSRSSCGKKRRSASAWRLCL